MQEIQILCPGCGRKYRVKGTTEVLKSKTFVCKCGFKAPFNTLYNMLNGGKVVPETPAPVPNNTNQENKTVIKNPDKTDTKKASPQSSSAMACLFVPSINRRVNVTKGDVVVGRMSSDSTSDLKLAPDPFMSRKHAKIKIGTKNGKRVFGIQSLKNENPVFVNNRPIFSNQVYILKHGDVITMGKTQIVFEIS